MKRPTKQAPAHDHEDLELLQDLERQSVEEIRKLRAHERIDLRIQLQIRPGNASQWREEPLLATTNDVSAGGCGAISPAPLLVGDIYRLEFERGKIDVPVVYARCVRCRQLRDDAFEVAMAFFNPIPMVAGKKPASKDLLD